MTDTDRLTALLTRVKAMHDWRPSPQSRDPERCAFGGCSDSDDNHVNRTTMLALLRAALASEGGLDRDWLIERLPAAFKAADGMGWDDDEGFSDRETLEAAADAMLREEPTDE